MIAQLMAAQGLMENMTPGKALAGANQGGKGLGLFSSLLFKAKNSMGGHRPVLSLNGNDAASGLEQLKERIIQSGTTLDKVKLTFGAKRDMKTLLALEGYSPRQIKEITAGFSSGETNAPVSAGDVLAAAAGMTPDFKKAAQGKTLEPQAIPYVETALSLAGMGPEKTKWAIAGAMTSDGKLSLSRLAENIKKELGQSGQEKLDMPTTLKILQALDQAGVAIASPVAEGLNLEGVSRILDENILQGEDGIPVVSQARLQTHLQGVLNNAVVEDEENGSMVSLKQLVESKLKLFDEEEFGDMPAMYVEMALRRMGMDSAEAGQAAAQVKASGQGKAGVLFKNLEQAEAFKNSLPQGSVPAFERMIQEMARNGELGAGKISLADFAQLLAGMNPQAAMPEIPLTGGEELQTLASLLSDLSAAKGMKESPAAGQAAALERKSVPQTLVELHDLLSGLADSGKTLPKAAVRDLAQVLKQAGADPGLVEEMLLGAQNKDASMDVDKAAQGIEKAASNILFNAAQDAEKNLAALAMNKEARQKVADILEVLQTPQARYLPGNAAKYVSKALDDLGVESQVASKILAHARVTGKGLDPAPVIQAVKNIAQRMGIDPEAVTAVQVETVALQDASKVRKVQPSGEAAFGKTGEHGRPGALLAEAELGRGAKAPAVSAGAEKNVQPVAVHEASGKQDAVVLEPQSQRGNAAIKGFAAAPQKESVVQNHEKPAVQMQTEPAAASQPVESRNLQKEISGVKADAAPSMRIVEKEFSGGPEKTFSETMKADVRKAPASGVPEQNTRMEQNMEQAPRKADVQAPRQERQGVEAAQGPARESVLGEPASRQAGRLVRVIQDDEQVQVGRTVTARERSAAQVEAGARAAALTGKMNVAEQPQEEFVEAPQRVQVHVEPQAGGGAKGRTVSVQTVENVRVEEKDGRRLNTRTDDVIVTVKAGSETAEDGAAARKSPGAKQTETRQFQAGLQAQAARANSPDQDAKPVQAPFPGMAAAEEIRRQGPEGFTPLVKEDGGLKEETAAVQLGALAKSRQDAVLAGKTLPGTMAAEKASDDGGQASGPAKSTGAPRGAEASGAFGMFRQEELQAGRAQEAALQRPILRPFEGQMAQQLGNYIALALKQRENRIRMQIHPQHLGAVDVNMSIKNKVLTLGMSAETEAVKEILMSHMAELKTALADQGITVAKIEVNVRADMENNFAHQQQGGREGRNAGGSGNGERIEDAGGTAAAPSQISKESGLDLMA